MEKYDAIQYGRDLDILVEWYKEFGYGYYYYLRVDEIDKSNKNENIYISVVVKNKILSILE